MEDHNDDDREVAIGHPVRGLHAHRFQPSRLSPDGMVFENGAPRQREGPGGQHKRHDQQGREPFSAGDIGTVDEPRQRDADGQRAGHSSHGDGKSVEQRRPKQQVGHA